ncbi:hypothetical protein Anas_08832 [Armadillidium nasatum]|uniref:Uncharacterized protein n=1 Tax=Armadillidium nasatum TaxID=96803 RepID=A0A5N5TGU7_9CRUS|nr:hypothetical protein Anas_08832 [Armadillidium nasatum]
MAIRTDMLAPYLGTGQQLVIVQTAEIPKEAPLVIFQEERTMARLTLQWVKDHKYNYIIIVKLYFYFHYEFN